MWGGLGLAVIDPQPRQGSLTIQASGSSHHERVMDVLNAAAGADITFVSIGLGDDEETSP